MIPLAIVLMLSMADPQLPPGITCELIREKVAVHGRLEAFTWALRNGYSIAQIRQAKRCLK